MKDEENSAHGYTEGSDYPEPECEKPITADRVEKEESDYTDYHCRHCGETNLVYTKELAALKAENERLKEEQKLWVDYYNTISKLQADKDELLEALKFVYTMAFFKSDYPGTSEKISSILSKHK